MVTRAAGRRAFAGLVAATGISYAGTAISEVAIPWLVLTSTGSASRTGVAAFAAAAPYVVTLVLAGPVIDRIGPRRASVLGNGVAAVVTGLIPALYAADLLRFDALIVLVALAAAVRGVADGATTALLPSAAERGGTPMERAAGLSSGATQGGMLVGAPIAGVLVAALGGATTVAVDAATFAVAAVLVGLLVPTAVAPPVPSGERMTSRRYFADLSAGFRFLRHDRLLVSLIAMLVIINVVELGLFAVMLPVWVLDRLGSPRALGLISGVFAAASIAGNLAATAAGARLPRRATYAIGFLVGGAPRFVALAVLTTLAPVLVIVGVTAFAFGVLNPIIGAVQYERIPEHLRARVMGAVRASAWIGIPFGPLLAGVSIGGFGLRPTLFIAGGIYLAATLAPLVFPVWRGLNRAAQAPSEQTPTAA